jgi:hypothetical protein
VARANGARRASDGTPVEGLAAAFVELIVDVGGSAGAQISVLRARPAQADGGPVLEVRLRNIGDAGARVTGTVEVGDPPSQHLTFEADVDARRDEVVHVPWKPPPKGSGAVVTVDVGYGNDDTASWSSPLDHPLVPEQPKRSTAVNTAAQSRAGSGGLLRFVLPALVLAIAAGASAWLVAEVRRGRRRRIRTRRTTRMHVPAVWSDGEAASLSQRIDELEQKVDALVGEPGIAGDAPAPRPIFDSVPMPIDSSLGYPFDWPTEADLEEFRGRRSPATDG